MVRTALRIVMITALVGIGWMAAKAQTSEPDFEFIVNAPTGKTTIECVRGCELAGCKRASVQTRSRCRPSGLNAVAVPQAAVQPNRAAHRSRSAVGSSGRCEAATLNQTATLSHVAGGRRRLRRASEWDCGGRAHASSARHRVIDALSGMNTEKLKVRS